MLSAVVSAVLLCAAAAAQTPTTVCVAGQCLQGTSNLSIGAIVVPPTGTSLLLLPGDYAASTEPQSLQSALTSASRISFTTGFAPTNNTSTSLVLPLNVALQPGVLSSAQPFYRGTTSFAALPTTQPTNNTRVVTSLALGSFLVSTNTWAAVSSGPNSRVVMWDPVADMSQLPQGLGASPLSLIDVQSSACAPACASAGVCSASGTCMCPPGFSGSSCETCAPGFFGPDCLACPSNCDKCDDGPTGSGACLIPAVADAPATCNCLNGVCGTTNQCTCNPGWTAASNGTACAACATGFFLTPGGDCQSCQLSCSQCSPSTGACTQCASGFTVSANDNTQCVQVASGKACPDASFDNGGTCDLCSPLCKTCTGASSSNCVVCAAGTYMLNGACVPTDASGVCSGSALIANNNKNLCDSCPAKCTSCGIPGFNVASTIDQAQCTKCLPGFFLSQGQCIEQCPAGTFISPTDDFTCVACDSSCSSCVGSSKFCLACTGGQLAANGTCTSSCPSSTFSSGGACLACHADCSKCSGAAFNQCTACGPARPVLQGAQGGSGRCLPTCSKAQFFDTSSGACVACDGSCSSCSAGGANSCLACAAPGSILRGGACVTATCTAGTAVIPGLAACLSDLVTPPPTAGIPASGGPSGGGGGGGTIVTRRPLAWWEILLMALGCAFLFVVALWVWRRRARKQRAARTALFAERMHHRGALSRGAHWLGARLRGLGGGTSAAHRREVALAAREKAVAEMLLRLNDAERGAGKTAQPSYEPARERDSWAPSTRSSPSLYSVLTHELRGAPETRAPLREERVPGSRFSSSSHGSHSPMRAPEFVPLEAVKTHGTGSSGQSYNPFRR